MTSPYFTGPNAPYSNVPPEPQYYEPSQFIISNIIQGATTTIITVIDHNYVVGQLVRFIIPYPWNMRQLNNQLAYVIGIPTSNSFLIGINSLQFDSFIPLPASPTTTLPQVLAIGDNNTGIISQTGRVVPTTAIPGSFINVSPT